MEEGEMEIVYTSAPLGRGHRHMVINKEKMNELKLFECNFCTRKFTMASAVVVHQENHNTGLRTGVVDCPMCQFIMTKEKLIKHIMREHTREENFEMYSKRKASFPDNRAMDAHKKKRGTGK